MSEVCVFCDERSKGDNTLIETGPWRARWDLYPATPGHLEVLPTRHVQYFEQLSDDELHSMMFFAREVMGVIRHADLIARYEDLLTRADDRNRSLQLAALRAMQLRQNAKPDAFNFGMNDGPQAGQTIPHLHFHLMPRWRGDMLNPRGGVRNLFQGDTYKNL